MGSILSLDPGFGNTKVCLDGNLSVIPSIVVQPHRIGKVGLSMKEASPYLEVVFQDQHFAIGSGAVEWGSPLGNFDYSSLASASRQALFYGALASLIPLGQTQVDLLTVGLPGPPLQDEPQLEGILATLKEQKGEHAFLVGGKVYRIDIQKLKVAPQPLGAYADWLLDAELRPRSNAAQAEVAVLDIGMNTVDLYVVRAGRVEPRFIAGEKLGVRRLLERLDGQGRDLEELDLDLRQGKLTLPPPAVQAWLSDLMAMIDKTMPRLSRFTVVILVGGGTLLLGNQLRLHLASRGAALYWPEDPIGSNARGLWKWSAYGLRH